MKFVLSGLLYSLQRRENLRLVNLFFSLRHRLVNMEDDLPIRTPNSPMRPFPQFYQQLWITPFIIIPFQNKQSKLTPQLKLKQELSPVDLWTPSFLRLRDSDCAYFTNFMPKWTWIVMMKSTFEMSQLHILVRFVGLAISCFQPSLIILNGKLSPIKRTNLILDGQGACSVPWPYRRKSPLPEFVDLLTCS